MTLTAEPRLDVQEDDGLIFACRLNGDGSGKLIGWAEVEAWKDGDPPIWVHLEFNSERAQAWIRERAGLTPATASALLATETRPRIFRGKRGLVAILRGMNFNSDTAGAEMIALRMWSEGQRVITVRRERLLTPRVILQSLIETGTGPTTLSELYERTISVLTERMSPTILALDERLDVLESQLDLSRANEQRRALSDIRQEAVVLRRYIAPQREAMSDLMTELPDWMDVSVRPAFRENIDRMTRYVEALDAVRERALVIKDDIASQMAEATNQTLYALAVISGIFLPLAFLTGLLGINIGGMPGVENGWAFWIFCAAITLLLALELVLFRKLKWI